MPAMLASPFSDRLSLPVTEPLPPTELGLGILLCKVFRQRERSVTGMCDGPVITMRSVSLTWQAPRTRSATTSLGRLYRAFATCAHKSETIFARVKWAEDKRLPVRL